MGFAPLIDHWRAQTEAINDAVFQRARLRATLADQPADIDRRDDVVSHRSIFIHEHDTIVDPRSRMQKHLSEIANRHTLAVQRMNARITPTEPDLQRVGVSLQLSGRLVGLRDLLYTIESHRPMVAVDRLTLQRPDRHRGSTESLDPVLDVHLDIIAFYAQNAETR